MGKGMVWESVLPNLIAECSYQVGGDSMCQNTVIHSPRKMRVRVHRL